MLKKLSLLAALVIMFSVATPAFAITWGTLDGNAHPYTGTLLFKAADGNFYSCSGTLLSPTVMLTAGHCVEDNGVENIETWVSFSPTPYANRNNYASRDAFLQAEWVKAADVVPHPNYAGNYPNTYDIGVVILSKAVKMSVYGQLPQLGLLDAVKAKKQPNRFKAVGYGMQGYINPVYSDEYMRYQGDVTLIELNSTSNGDAMSAKFTNNPGKGGGGTGGTCYGDSGGPVFHGDGPVVAAIVSWGITPCIGVDYQLRVDTPIAQDFVRPFLRK